MCLLFAAGCAARSGAIDYRAILDHPLRPESERALDAYRKPELVLEFYQVRPGERVADIMTARGYYTVLLSQAVGPRGVVYALDPKPRKELDERLEHPALANVRKIDNLEPPRDAALDFALIHLNYHDLPREQRAALNRSVYAALKPGGRYGIVDHSARDGSGEEFTRSLHRIDKVLVIREVTEAGFVLVKEGDMFRNPADPRTASVLKERGQSDRFVLYFARPK
jgi:predicted methyltransferase